MTVVMEKEIVHFDLDHPLANNIVKTLANDELETLCKDIRENIIKHTSINGGHLSSNLGVVEITVAMHKVFDFPKDKVVFDVGHQCYTHKILSGRTLNNLRHKDGVCGFPNKSESEYDIYETGHSSTSISAVMGMAMARDINNDNYETIALIGDSAFTNGISLEAMNLLSTFPHKVIIVLNDNNRAISASRGQIKQHFEKMRLSKSYLSIKKCCKNVLNHKFTRFLYRFLRAIKNFFKYHLLTKKNFLNSFNVYAISNIDGHDIESLTKAFEYAKRSEKSIILHITTIKGKGYKYALGDETGKYHGVEPFSYSEGLKPSSNDKEISWSKVYSDLVEYGLDKDEKMVVVNPATTIGSKLDDIFDKYPNRCIDVGIAEEHGAIFASGLANDGLKPYYSIYSTFMQRAYDELSHDISRMDQNVTLLIDRAGLPNSDGETHQGVFDVAILNSMPNFAIAMAKDMNEAKALFDFSLNYNHPLAIRYPRGNTKIIKEEEIKLELGKWVIEKEDKDIAIISTGPIVNDLINEIDATIVNAIFLRPLDKEMLTNLMSYKDVIIYDIYGIEEGFSSLVLSELNKMGYKGNIHVMSIPNVFIKHDNISSQLKTLNIDLDTLKEKIKEIKSGY